MNITSRITCCIGFAIILASCIISTPVEEVKQSSTIPGWTMAGFEKVDSLNPILVPSTAETFFCPVSKKQVAWNERNVLNPAAVVKDGKVYLLFRSQDTAMTSRLGLAVSEDGLHFIRTMTA
jgi:beta-1,2-mannosidase